MSDITTQDLLAAADAVVQAGRASTPVLRKQLGVGYTRANTLLDTLEQHHVVGPSDGVHPREVLVPDWDTWAPIRLEYFDADAETQQQLREAIEDRKDFNRLVDAEDDALADEIADAHFLDGGVDSDETGVVPGPQRTFVTVHSGQLARVLSEAARFCDVSEDSEPRCWVELSVSGGWLHGMAFNGGTAAQLASAMIHADDAKALARVIKHKGKANEFDRATLIFDPEASTLYVERVEVEDQRDVRITLTDYRGTTLDDDSGDPMGWMRVDEFAATFEPDDQPIGALRVHPEVLALFAGLMDAWRDGARFTFGRQRSAHSGRPVLVRIQASFTGYVLSLDPNLEGVGKPDSNYRPFDMVDPAERDYVRPAVAS